MIESISNSVGEAVTDEAAKMREIKDVSKDIKERVRQKGKKKERGKD